MSADPRFFRILGPVRLAELAGPAVAEGSGELLIDAAGPLLDGPPGAIAYLDGKVKGALSTQAAAVFLRAADQTALPPGVVALVAPSPRAAFAGALRKLYALRDFQPTSEGAIAQSAHLEAGVTVGPGAVIGPDARIGAGTRVEPNAVIGPGVCVGRNCRIGANASLQCALLGDGVEIGANSVVGENGFGVAGGGDGPIDLFHVGRAILMDRVSLGACVTVDRGLFADTVVGEGTKIDNHSQIAHNVKVGRGALMAAFAGISGSVDIGDSVVLGGRVGVGDHVRIGAGAAIGAGSGVLREVPERETWAGYPAKPLRRWQRELIWIERGARKRDASE